MQDRSTTPSIGRNTASSSNATPSASGTTNAKTSSNKKEATSRTSGASGGGKGRFAEVVIVEKSRRCAHLLLCSKCVLVFLCLWALVLVLCALFLLVASAFRARHLLVVGRHFYCLSLFSTLAHAAWLVGSLYAVLRRDNLNSVTMLGLLALVLISLDILTLCYLFTMPLFAHGLTDSVLATLAHPEMMHHRLLLVSRIVCLALWQCFASGELARTKWTPLQNSVQVNLDTTDLTEFINELLND